MGRISGAYRILTWGRAARVATSLGAVFMIVNCLVLAALAWSLLHADAAVPSQRIGESLPGPTGRTLAIPFTDKSTMPPSFSFTVTDVRLNLRIS